MSEIHSEKKKGKAKGLVSMALVLAMCFSVLPMVLPDATATPIPATISTPMTISTNTNWDSGTCELSANLSVVSPATLRIANVTINVVNNWTTSGGHGGGNKSIEPFLEFNDYFGIKVQSGAKLIIYNSTIQGKTKSDIYNILVEGTVDIRSSTFKQLDNDGIYIDGDDGVDPVISGNTFLNSRDALTLNDTTSNINNNTFTSINNEAIYFSNADLDIRGNTFSGTQSAAYGYDSTCLIEKNNMAITNSGIYVYSSDCSIRNNTVHGDQYGNIGIDVEYPDAMYDIYDNEIYDVYTGIYTWGASRIFKNRIHDCDQGISAYFSGGGNKTARALAGPNIHWNNLTNIRYTGISVQQANNIVVENNTITTIGSSWDIGRAFNFEYSGGRVSDNKVSDIAGYGFVLRQGASNLAFSNNKISDVDSGNQGSVYCGAIAVEYADTWSEWDLRNGYFIIDNVGIVLRVNNGGTVRVWDMDLTGKGMGTTMDFYVLGGWASSNVQLYDTAYDEYTLDTEKYSGQGEASIEVYWSTEFAGYWESTMGPIDMGDLTVKDSLGDEAFTGQTDSSGRLGPFYLCEFGEKITFSQYNYSQVTERKDHSPYWFHFEKGAKGRIYFSDKNQTVDGKTNVTIFIDDVNPLLEISSPLDGSLVNTTTIIVSGKTEVLSSVTINGVKANIFTNGDFEAQIDLDKEGKNTITAISTDKGLNQAWIAINITRDTIAPGLTVTTPENGDIFNKMMITVKGTTEPGANLTVQGQTVNVGLNGSWETTVTYTKEGANAVAIISKDPAGNSVTESRGFVIDITPPTLIIGKPFNNTLTKYSSVDVSGSVEKECNLVVNGRRIIYDGTLWSTTVELAEGTNNITVVATDVAGNSKTGKVTVVRDSTPPMLQVDSPIDNLRTGKFSITVSGTTEIGAIIRINGIEAPNLNGSFSDSVFLSEGSNRITVEASDAAGNMATKVRKVFKEAGGTADPVTITSPANGTVISGNSVTIKGSLNEAGILTVNGQQVTVDTNDNFEYTVPLVEGINVITLTLKDGMGNNYTVSWTIIRDTVPPEITVTSPKSKVDQANVLVQGKTEPGATVTVNGMMVYVSATGDFTAPATLNPGKNKIYITAVDKVGNAYTKTVDVKYEPTGGVTGLGAGSEATLGLFVLLIVLVIVIMVLIIMLMVKMGGKGGQKRTGPVDEDDIDDNDKTSDDEDEAKEEEDDEEDDAPTLEKGDEKDEVKTTRPSATKAQAKAPASKMLPPPLPPNKSSDMKVVVKK